MKNLLLKISIICLTLGLTTACHTQRHYTGNEAQYQYKSGNIIHKGTSHFFIAGIGQTDKIDAIAICGTEENIQAVESKTTFLNGLIGAVTLSIYTPREYTVYCK